MLMVMPLTLLLGLATGGAATAAATAAAAARAGAAGAAVKSAGAAVKSGLAITPDGTGFVLNGKPQFLKGISYFGFGSGPEAAAALNSDLDAIQRCGMNWLRLWVTWNEWSMLTTHGMLISAQVARLSNVLKELERRGMAADLTLNRESDSGKAMNCGDQKCGGLVDQASHLRGVCALAKLVKPFRGVYFDVSISCSHRSTAAHCRQRAQWYPCCRVSLNLLLHCRSWPMSTTFRIAVMSTIPICAHSATPSRQLIPTDW